MTDMAVSLVSSLSSSNPAKAIPASAGDNTGDNGTSGLSFNAGLDGKTVGLGPTSDQWQSRDGDSVSLSANSGALTPVSFAFPAKSWDDVRKIMTKVKNELRKQQADQLRPQLPIQLRGPGGKLVGVNFPNGAALAIVNPVTQDANPPQDSSPVNPGGNPGSKAADPAASPDAANNSANDYWSAENTANRIANFAMQFAEAHGDDPGTFARTIKDAVELGFSQAQGTLGDLPGKAGEVNRQTHALTFKKLDERLDAWKASLYNGQAQSSDPTAGRVA